MGSQCRFKKDTRRNEGGEGKEISVERVEMDCSGRSHGEVDWQISRSRCSREESFPAAEGPAYLKPRLLDWNQPVSYSRRPSSWK